MTTVLYCLACGFVAWRVCRSLSNRKNSRFDAEDQWIVTRLRKVLEKEEAA